MHNIDTFAEKFKNQGNYFFMRIQKGPHDLSITKRCEVYHLSKQVIGSDYRSNYIRMGIPLNGTDSHKGQVEFLVWTHILQNSDALLQLLCV
jgi:hypothetical protein